MITTINEFKNMNESYVRQLSNMVVGDTFIIRFKVSMPRSEGRIVYPNVQTKSIEFELINIQDDTTDNRYTEYVFKFHTGIPNKYIKPSYKPQFFQNNFIYNGNVAGGMNNVFADDDFDSYKNLVFDDKTFDGTVTFIKKK